MSTVQEQKQTSPATIDLVREADIRAPIDITFQATLDEMGPEFRTPDGDSLAMILEPWPGGRWYRDLGKGVGHLWGHVQVIKPPTLIEITGPLFMSYPAINHVQYRLTAKGDHTHLTLTHRAYGLITEDHREGVRMGWDHMIQQIQELVKRA